MLRNPSLNRLANLLYSEPSESILLAGLLVLCQGSALVSPWAHALHGNVGAMHFVPLQHPYSTLTAVLSHGRVKQWFWPEYSIYK